MPTPPVSEPPAMAAESPEDPLGDIPEFGLFPVVLKDAHVPDPTPGVEAPHLLDFLMNSMEAKGPPKFLNDAEGLCEAYQEQNAKDPFSRLLANSPDHDIVEQRGPARYLQRGPSQLKPTSEPNEDDEFESEDRVNSTASGNSRPEADLRGKNIERRTFVRRPAHSGKNIEQRTFVQRPAHSENAEYIPDENVEIQQNKAQKRKVPTLDPVSEVRRLSLIMKKSTSELASKGRRTKSKVILRRKIMRRKIMPPLKPWLGQGFIYAPCSGKQPKVVGWKEVSIEEVSIEEAEEAVNEYKWEEMRFEKK